MKLDKWACAKAVGVLMLSWFAFPILYHMFKKEERDEKKIQIQKEEKEVKENDGKE